MSQTWLRHNYALLFLRWFWSQKAEELICRHRAEVRGLQCSQAALLPPAAQRLGQPLFQSPGLTFAFVQHAVLHIHVDTSHDVRDLEPTVPCHVYGLVNSVLWYLLSTHHVPAVVILPVQRDPAVSTVQHGGLINWIFFLVLISQVEMGLLAHVSSSLWGTFNSILHCVPCNPTDNLKIISLGAWS